MRSVLSMLVAFIAVGAIQHPIISVMPILSGAGLALWLHGWTALIIGAILSLIVAAAQGADWIANGAH